MKVVLKNGIKVRISRLQAQLLTDTLMKDDTTKDQHIRINNNGSLVSLFTVDDISAII